MHAMSLCEAGQHSVSPCFWFTTCAERRTYLEPTSCPSRESRGSFLCVCSCAIRCPRGLWCARAPMLCVRGGLLDDCCVRVRVRVYVMCARALGCWFPRQRKRLERRRWARTQRYPCYSLLPLHRPHDQQSPWPWLKLRHFASWTTTTSKINVNTNHPKRARSH